MAIRNRLKPEYIPGQLLKCCPQLSYGVVDSGCPQVVDISFTTAGAAAGDCLELVLKTNAGGCFSNAYVNCLNQAINTWCNPMRFKWCLTDPLTYQPEAAIGAFEELLNLDVRLNGAILLERLNETTFTLTARAPWITFSVEDASVGFTITQTEWVAASPSSRINYGSLVFIDDCGRVQYTSAENPFFLGFSAHCQNKHENACGDAKPRNYYNPGESVPVNEGDSDMAIPVAGAVVAIGKRLAFDPANPPGVALPLAYNEPVPTGGFILEGWTITNFYQNTAIISKIYG